MPYEICITVYDSNDNLQSSSLGMVSELPTPANLAAIANLVMADGDYAVATVHKPNELEIIYGIIVEGNSTLQGGYRHG